MIKATQEDDVQVYLVGILDESEEGSSLFGKSATKKAKELLIRLAEDSGGHAYFPKDASEVSGVMNQIAKDLRSQYVISYSPTNEKRDGTFRTIKVVVTPKDNRKLIVRTRQGYTTKCDNPPVGIVLLTGGAHATVTGAVGLARLLGWSERVIGLTIVSAGTGLPEVVASLVSSVRGHSDIAIGNVIGSNLFNILGTLGLCALVVPLPVQPALFTSDCRWMLGVTLLLFPLMFAKLRVNRGEGGILLVAYLGYLTLLLLSGEK